MDLQNIYDQINNKTNRDYPQIGLHDVIRRQAEQTPDAIAVLDDNGTQTYAQLNEKSDQLAAYLRSLGIDRGDLVGLCCNRDVDMPALLIGVMKSGAAYVPLDPDYPIDRLTYMVGDSQIKHVIAHSEQLPLTEKFDVPTTVVDRDWDQIAAAASEFGELNVPTEPKTDLAYVIYTSGSTGNQKVCWFNIVLWSTSYSA